MKGLIATIKSKIKRLISKTIVFFISVHRLLAIIRNTVEMDSRVKLFLSEIEKSVGDERINIYLREIEKAADKEKRIKLYHAEMARSVEEKERFLIPSFENGYGQEKQRFSYQKNLVPFDIADGEKVLDIGSGGDPFPYATHLADLHDGETTHRSDALKTQGLPFRTCNIEHLPYGNKEFDFVYCSHVLEHVEHPDRACEELMRVGKRGYIETPTRTSDIMLNFIGKKNHHKWHINLLGNTLVFMEWGEKERRDTEINDFYLMLHSKYKNSFQELVHKQRDLFVNMLIWRERYNYFVFNKEGKLIATNRDKKGT